MNIKPRERTAILQSLAAGVVPRTGLHHIQVGRKRELEALLGDLSRIEEGGAGVRFVIGRFGSGKSFFLNLVRTVALERKMVVLQADITLDRRLHGTGAAVALYTELMNNMSTRAKPEGGALPGLIERFVTEIHNEVVAGSGGPTAEQLISKKLQPMLEMTHGTNFVRVLAKYVEAYATQNDQLTNAAMRWLRGEYKTRTEARQDLSVRDIVEDTQLYDMLKLWSKFVRIAGYQGLFVNVDEMVVLSERLNNGPARVKNYEVLLQVLNDCLQGHVEGLGFCFAGTEEFLSDRRRGLFSYEAMATRLADNPFAKDAIDMNQPVVRLQSLTKEDLYVLLERISLVQACGDQSKLIMVHEGILKFLSFCERRLGAEHFLTPRDTVKQYVGLLNVLEQNPDKNLDTLLQADEQSKPRQESDVAESQSSPKLSDGDDVLAKFTL